MSPLKTFKQKISKISQDLAAARPARGARDDATAKSGARGRLKLEVKDSKAARGALAAIVLVILAFLVSLILA